MKLTAICCTYHRPHLLGQLIESFLRQDYPRELRELIILDDAGQYGNQHGDGWSIISIPDRFATLGEKRNACAALASPDSEGLLVADDDDIYLPHWFRVSSEALRKAEWSHPSLVILEYGDNLRECKSNGYYHGGWGFRRETFTRLRGYANLSVGEDIELLNRFRHNDVTECDPCEFSRPFYFYRRTTGSYHTGRMQEEQYGEIADVERSSTKTFKIGWPIDFCREIKIAEFPRTFSNTVKPVIELIGEAKGTGRKEQTVGMYSLQQVLKRRMLAGRLNWLSVREEPSSLNVIPWFWSRESRPLVHHWIATGMPFIVGPDYFPMSRRVGREDQSLVLDNDCRLVLWDSPRKVHEFRQSLIRGEQAPVYHFEFPLDPWPNITHDTRNGVFIFSGHRQRELTEAIAAEFPGCPVMRQGNVSRSHLWEVALQSRACIYIPEEDDWEPIALKEILLCGCPVVGPPGVSKRLISGVTGIVVQRPGAKTPERSLEAFIEGVKRAVPIAQEMNPAAVLSIAGQEFETERVLKPLFSLLEKARSCPAELVSPPEVSIPFCRPSSPTPLLSPVPFYPH